MNHQKVKILLESVCGRSYNAHIPGKWISVISLAQGLSGENMIIVKLIGGLGNQMFQYAAGRCLAHKYRTELKLDIRDFKNYTLRNYDLNGFSIIENFATSSELSRILFPSDRCDVKFFKRVIWSVSRIRPVEYIKETEYSFQQNFFKLPDNIYLDGYWQSEKYFLDIENIIRNEFSVVNPLTSTSQDLAERIRNCEAVSLHVRRGDYVSDPKTNSVHGVCGVDYYSNAINMIRERIENPCFFIFSDDSEWARSNIKPDAPTTYVKHNDYSRDYEDMCLMSMCKHNIIANSSFSWWGAWLNENPEKIVIAPKKWFNSKNMDTQDLLPDKWHKL